jgi:hypothetical protein
LSNWAGDVSATDATRSFIEPKPIRYLWFRFP